MSVDESKDNNISNHFFPPGISSHIFKAMKRKLQQIPLKERLCVLLFSELSIVPSVDYLHQENRLIGHEDFGTAETEVLADHAIVFMIRSIYGNWKQPIAFAFYEWPLEKQQIIQFYKEIVTKATAIGLNLVASVCNHLDYNMKAINQLLAETRAKPSKQREEIKDNVIVINGHPIVPLFDPPFLLTRTRYNLVNKNLEFERRGVKKHVKWQHVLAAFKVDLLKSGFLKKITLQHVSSTPSTTVTNVTHCAQVFSSTFGGFIVTVAGKADHEFLPLEARETGEFLMFIDKIFDSVNGSMQVPPDKPLRGPVTENSPHSAVWQEGKELLSKARFMMTFYENYLFEGWIRTLDGFAAVKEILLGLRQTAFPARAFNLDPLENCLSLMMEWVKNKYEEELTCKQFSFLYNLGLKSRDISRYHAACSPCEPDGLRFLLSPEDLTLQEK